MLVTSVHLGRGNIVYMEGKFGNEMYFIISGEVEVSVSGQRLGFLGT
jgi:CRP-like cAMP-binding protein